MTDKIIPLRVIETQPKAVVDLQDLFNRIANIGYPITHVLCVVEYHEPGAKGTVVLKCNANLTDDHANWLLDRAKLALHEDDWVEE